VSIHPRVAIKNKIKNVILHMKITNNTNKGIFGTIRFKIKRPDKLIDIIEKKVFVRPNSVTNKYFKYSIAQKPVGKYKVDGRFFWDKNVCRSMTYKNDYFYVK